ncbi:MAG: hypothetical protein RIR65_657 [Planctomycetota bacterium]
MLLRSLALLVLCSPVVEAQVKPTAHEVTEPWRGLAHMFDRCLPPDLGKEEDNRNVALLLDATRALKSSGFESAFTAALDRHGDKLGRTRFTVQRLGEDKPVLVDTGDIEAVKQAVAKALETEDERIKNIYAELRDFVGPVATRSGEKVVLLATLDNGDAEDDVEATAARLRGVGVRLHILAGEAYVADTYWAWRRDADKPKGTEFHGGDSAVVDLPFGWLFQQAVANEVTPAGHAAWGLNRLAAVAGGRVHVYSASGGGEHLCAPMAVCVACSGDHIAPDEVYSRARLAEVAPSAAARDDVLRELAADPWHRATLAAWNASLKAGLVSGAPPKGTEPAGTDSAATGRQLLFSGANPARNAAKAEQAAKDAQRILEALDADLAKIAPDAGAPRQRAIAEYTRVMLRLTKANLLLYAAWSRELAPRMLDEDALYEPPEVTPHIGSGRVAGTGWNNRTLCHGVDHFHAQHLPGGDAVRAELKLLESEFDAYMARHAHGPWAVAIHRAGVAYFHLTWSGLAVESRVRPKSKGATESNPKTGGARPARGGGSSGGSGPRTGG